MLSPALVCVVGMGRVPSLTNHPGVVLGSPGLKEGGEEPTESPPDSAVGATAVSEAVAPTVEGAARCRLSISALFVKVSKRAANGGVRVPEWDVHNMWQDQVLGREPQFYGRCDW